MDCSVREELYARAIGWKVLEYLEGDACRLAERDAQWDAFQVLEKIRQTLDDSALDDKECFQQIERIVSVFYANGISTRRHDW